MNVDEGLPPSARIVLPADSGPRKLAQTLAALANGAGGAVYLPLEGLDPAGQAALLDQAVAAALSCEPPLVIPLPRPATVDGRPALALHVPPGLPHVYALEGAYWQRQNGRNVALGPQPLRQLFLQRGNAGQDALALPGATLADLDWDAVEAYAAALPSRPAGTLQELLRGRGGLAPDNSPTHAGILVFGRAPQQYLPAAEMLLIRYPGTAMGDTFLKEIVRGPLPEQIRRAEAFLASNMRRGARINALSREERPEYPLPAVRECIVNAVAHRDYTVRGEEIRVELFADRLEVYSPGRLPGHVTLDNLAQERFARNEVLVQLLTDLGFVERLGYGIDRMLQLMNEEGLPAPEFVETANGFRVTLRGQGERLIETRPDGFRWNTLALNPRQEKALAYLAQHGRITNREFQDLCAGVSPETIRRDLADLVESDVLIRIGDKRATFYILKK